MTVARSRSSSGACYEQQTGNRNVSCGNWAGGLAGSWATARTGRSPFGKVDPVAMFVSSADSEAIGRQVSFTNGFVPVAKKVLPAVVNIASSKIVRSPDQGTSSPFFADPFFRQFFGDDFSQQFHVPRQGREHSLGVWNHRQCRRLCPDEQSRCFRRR